MKYDIKKILESFPNDSNEKLLYVARIKEYSNECGCSWGAKFMIASIGVVAVYIAGYNWRNENLIKVSLTALLFIVIGGGIGKMIGIVVAKIKLQLLYKSLINKHKSQKL